MRGVCASVCVLTDTVYVSVCALSLSLPLSVADPDQVYCFTRYVKTHVYVKTCAAYTV